MWEQRVSHEIGTTWLNVCAFRINAFETVAYQQHATSLLQNVAIMTTRRKYCQSITSSSASSTSTVTEKNVNPSLVLLLHSFPSSTIVNIMQQVAHGTSHLSRPAPKDPRVFTSPPASSIFIQHWMFSNHRNT